MAGRYCLRFALALGLAAASPASAAPSEPTRLFAADEPISIRIQGPISAIAARAATSLAPRPAVLTVSGATETLPIMLSPRGLSRRQRQLCGFPPLRVEFTARPGPSSLFERQRRLKLVTHCRQSADFQQHLLLEFAAYRLYNRITPASFRVRLANIDYVDTNGRVTNRLGFFVEDLDDMARRSGMRAAQVGESVPVSQLSAREAARFAIFEYMIGNLDWSMRAGPKGERCCHNSKLVWPNAPGARALVPIPYDFDLSGLVSAPYAFPPEGINVSSVRERRYRGLCAHNREALAVAAEFRLKRSELLAELAGIPGLDESTRRRALAYIDTFFNDVADDQRVATKLLRTCVRMN
jgi:hypothetical protein